MRDVFAAVEAVRSRVDAPVLVMTYWNPVVQYGVDRFADALRDAGGAGLITPDITPDAAADWIAESERTGLDRVFLAAPSSTDARLAETVAASRGFVYAVSTMGITGARADVDADGPHARRPPARRRSHRPRDLAACVGVGISTADQVAEVLGYADGAIVGSALVTALAEGGVAGVGRRWHPHSPRESRLPTRVRRAPSASPARRPTGSRSTSPSASGCTRSSPPSTRRSRCGSRSYALVILVGIVAAVLIANARLTRRGAEPWVIVDVGIWAVLLGIIGARLYHVFTHPDDYFGPGKNVWNPFEPGSIWAIWEGGVAIFGALIGGAIGVWIGCRITGLRFWSVADALAPGLLVAQAFGRLGNWFNQELFGLPTDLPWGLEIDRPTRPSRSASPTTCCSTRRSSTRSSGTSRASCSSS